MSGPADIWATTAVQESGAQPGTPVAAAVELRADVLQMTQVAEDAVLRPREPGCWPHDLRLALACRIARLNGADDLAERYSAMLDETPYASVADPATACTDAGLQACLAFTDQVATRPRDVTARDIQILQEAGTSDADIVRLTELNAFLAYQIRLTTGLALIAGMPA